MSMVPGSAPETVINFIQPVSDDYSTDGYLKDFARIDHQHPLSASLRRAIFNSTTYVKRTGDTMIGALQMSTTNQLQFNDSQNYIAYLNNSGGHPWYTGLRLVATNGWSFYNVVQGTDVMGYRGVSGTYYLWVSNKALIGSSPSDAIATSALNIAGNCAFTAGYSLLWQPYTAVSCWAQDNSWFRAGPNLYCAGTIGAGGNLNVGAGGGTGGYTFYCAGTIGCTSNLYAAGQIQAGADMYSGNVSNSLRQIGRQALTDWTTVAIQALPYTSTAAICFHSGSVAPMIGNTNGFANNLYHRDAAYNPGSSSCVAASYITESSRAWKKNINTWPLKAVGAAVERVTDLVAKLRPVTYEYDYIDRDLGGGKRSEAYIRLTTYQRNRGLPTYEMPEHDCAEHDCDGTENDPCARHILRNTPRIGFIAEELAEVFPSAAPIGKEKNPEGVDLGQLLAIAIAAIQELTERINVLEGVN